MIGPFYLLLAVYLYALPGYALLAGWSRPGHIAARLGIAIALSVAIYPILYVWAWTLEIEAGRWAVWGPGAAGALALLWASWRRRARDIVSPPVSDSPPIAEAANRRGYPWDLIALAGLVALIAFTRGWAIRDMAAPAWGDSFQHTLIVQLMLDHGGLFQSWMPYAPLETFTYHPGLHANLTVWAAATGLPADQAVLVGGQVLNVLAVLALYPLAYRLSGSAWVGVLSMGAAGLLFSMPGYYTNWGRYTQLGAQIILPGLLWSFDRLWRPRPASASDAHLRDPAAWTAVLLAVLAAGLALTHYRVVMIGAAGGAAWALWGLWRVRGQWRAWLRCTVWAAAAALAAGILAAPWLLRLGQGRLTTVAGAMSAPATSPTASAELVIWTTATLYYPVWLMLLAGLALAWAVWRAPNLGRPLALWAGLTFLIANPALVGMRGSGLVSNFLLLIGLYVVFAPLVGCLLWQVSQWIIPRSPYPRVAAGLLIAAALGLAAWGASQQARIVTPSHELVTPQDLAVMAWIDEHTPPDAYFLANSFLAFGDTTLVGADAGWWLPYYTGRAVNVLPITYTMETVAATVDKDAMRQLVLEVRASEGDAAALRAALCRGGITHLYQGQRITSGAAPHEQLFHAAWLDSNPDFELLQREGDAAVWAFSRAACADE